MSEIGVPYSETGEGSVDDTVGVERRDHVRRLGIRLWSLFVVHLLHSSWNLVVTAASNIE